MQCTYIVCSYLCMCDLHLDCYDRLDKNSFTIFPSQALKFVISSVIIMQMVGFFPKFSHSGLTIGKSFRVLSVFQIVVDLLLVILNEIDSFFHQLSQNVTTNCPSILFLDHKFSTKIVLGLGFGFKSESILPILFKNHLKKY